MLKNSASQLHTITNKLDDKRDTAVSGTDINSFGFRLNEKLSKSKKFTILGNSGAMKKLKFLTSNAKKAFNLLRQSFTKVPIF